MKLLAEFHVKTIHHSKIKYTMLNPTSWFSDFTADHNEPSLSSISYEVSIYSLSSQYLVVKHTE